jgi:uncharacterized protein (TIGR02246 family)
MRVIIALLVVSLLFGCQTMQSQDTAKQQIAAVTQEWIDDMTAHDMDRVTALYDRDAVLWGTRSPTIRTTPEKVREYFGILRKVPPSYKATLGEEHIRVYGDIAINSGTYTFSEERDGKEVLRPARFSIVFRREGGRWLIVDHHSSAVPTS